MSMLLSDILSCDCRTDCSWHEAMYARPCRGCAKSFNSMQTYIFLVCSWMCASWVLHGRTMPKSLALLNLQLTSNACLADSLSFLGVECNFAVALCLLMHANFFLG